MTLKTRNTVIGTALILSALVTVISFLSILLVHIDASDSTIIKRSLSPVLFAVTCCVLGVSIQFSFRKTLSAEITLFVIFIILAAFDTLKPGMMLLRIFRKPVAWSATLTRIVYLFRFAGIFCFIAAGLFASGLSSQRLSITLGLCFFLACTFSIIIPIDSSIRDDNYLYRLGMHKDIQTALLVLEIIAIINYITAAIRNNEKAYVPAALGAACALIGREMLFFHHTILHITAGFLLFLFGTILYANRIHHLYLWK